MYTETETKIKQDWLLI